MIAGILISVLLFFLIRQLAKGRAHAVVLANDMTKELRESEQRWKSALEAAGDGLWGWNLQTGAVFFSSRLAEMFGYAHDEISGGIEDAWEKRIHPDDYDRVMAEKREIEEGKMVTCYNEHRLPCKNGDWKWVLVRGMVLEYTPDGKPARLIGTMTDITNRKINEDRIKRLTHLYAALSHCNQAIVRCVSEETLFSEVCRIAVEFGGMKMAWIGTLSEGNRTFEVIASYGISEEYLTGVQLYVDPDTHTVAGPAREVIHGNSAIWCQDYLNGPFNIPSKERALKFGWRAMAALPLRRDGVVAGLFSLYASEVNGFDQESRALLEELVSNISHAIDNLAHEAARKSAEIEISDSRARLAELSIKLIKAQEEERKNLARELHDELGQRLTALNMGWHSIRASLNGRESEERWTQTCDQLSSLIGLVRTISGSLRPPMLDYLGLEESLRQLLRQQFFNTEIQYVFEYVGLPQKLSAQIEITVYRLVQEGVTNILRHAEANQVTVELNGGEHGDELEIIIRDNGKGVELTQQDGKPQRSGFGLAGMRERAMLLGGKFKFQSAFAHGTRIEVQLPLK
ncbi:MAG: GAF domain-containing protein [Burkholderiaceae bacterium]|nr:GAF domain-containing protein [Burkholderiaceae bacterium]